METWGGGTHQDSQDCIVALLPLQCREAVRLEHNVFILYDVAVGYLHCHTPFVAITPLHLGGSLVLPVA